MLASKNGHEEVVMHLTNTRMMLLCENIYVDNTDVCYKIRQSKTFQGTMGLGSSTWRRCIF